MKNSFFEKVLVIFSITFFVSVLIMFMWQEDIDLSARINDSKIANFFISIGALATAASLILLYKQIMEMQEDRRASNKPDLYPENTVYNVQTLDRGIEGILLEVAYQTSIDDDEVERNFNVYNIGLGAAKEIKFSWEFDSITVKNITKGKFQYYDDVDGKTQSLNFLPADQKAKVAPPYNFLSCCAWEFNKKEIPMSNEVFIEKSDKPEIRLIISYKDIYNYDIKKVFQCYINSYLGTVIFIFMEEVYKIK